VIGIDVEDSQFEKAREQAKSRGLNVEFRKTSVYELPFEDHSFDAAFSHVLLEHLVEPGAALVELRRVLKPGGWIGVRAGDMGGILVDAAPRYPRELLPDILQRNRKTPKIQTWAGSLGASCAVPGSASRK
jgi:ubiquinone/menaquinone biosynthesis C-methylase UbiE